LPGDSGASFCNGLIIDWASWQKENGPAYEQLKMALAALSPSEDEKLSPGALTRVSLDDSRDIPTLKMPYGAEVPVLYASAGIRRIVALAYLLVWSWQEHQKASELLDEETTNQITFLIDEVEAHLHPKWQRTIIGALLEVVKSLAAQAQVQILAATHSPLVLASVEPLFDDAKDAWFDLDLIDGDIHLTRRDFEKHGDVTNWLTSDAFDLKSSIALPYENLLDEAATLLDDPNATPEQAAAMNQRLIVALNPKDTFLFRWRAIAAKKDLLK